MSRTLYTSQAFLLHRRSYQGNSLLLDFLTKDFGLIRCVGRGVRNTKKKQPITQFLRLNIQFQGKNNLKTLVEFDINDTPRYLDKSQLLLGIYANELLSKLLLPNEEYENLLQLYQWYIENLSQIKSQQQNQQHWLIRLFEKQLLDILGYGLDYQFDNLDRPIQPDKYYYFQANTGFILAETGDISGALLIDFVKANPKQPPDTQQLRLARLLLQSQLTPLLSNKPLESRLLLQNPIKYPAYDKK